MRFRCVIAQLLRFVALSVAFSFVNDLIPHAFHLIQLTPYGIVLRSSKAGKQAVIPWDDELRRLVQEIKADNLGRGKQGSTLFCKRDGMPYNKDKFHSRWQYGMRKAMHEGHIEWFT